MRWDVAFLHWLRSRDDLFDAVNDLTDIEIDIVTRFARALVDKNLGEHSGVFVAGPFSARRYDEQYDYRFKLAALRAAA